MHFLSRNSFNTLKNIPNGSDNHGTGLLLQAGYIRQEMAGAYNYLPLGLRTLRKIENIIRDEMDQISQEVLLTALGGKAKWEATGRWDTIDVLFKVPGSGNKQYSLNPTHEEFIAPIIAEFVQSYKQLPCAAYQIQTKFRNEARAKSGLLRGREFLMKDLYSFHENEDCMDEYFEKAKQAYENIFNRLGIGEETYYTIADGGTFSKYGYEYQTRLGIGEDLIFYSKKTDTYYNQEIAPSIAFKVPQDNEFKDLEVKETKDCTGVEALCKEFNIQPYNTTKTLLYIINESEMIAIVVRGDYEVNDVKLKHILGEKKFRMATNEEIIKHTGSETGYAGLYNLPDSITAYIDEAVEKMVNFETGGNKTYIHVCNMNWDRDIKKPEKFYDLKLAKPGDIDPESGEEYETFQASEVGNIYKLGKKFPTAANMKVLNKDGKMTIPLMGCYGIGVSRVMGVIAEKFTDEKGLIWPENIAPYSHYIIVHGEYLEEAKNLAKKLESEGKEVLIDDRDIGFWMKARDADLLGIPHRIIFSKKTIEQGGYEIKERCKEEKNIQVI